MKNPKSEPGPNFDFERLIVFQKALRLLQTLAPFLGNPPRKAAAVTDHLDRALSSILLNIAEGSGKEPGSRDRKRFYRTALGSAKESGACLIVLAARGFHSGPSLCKGRRLCLEVVAMLRGMSR
jgi:four helix bundle protein